MLASSSVYETAPQGEVTDQPDFLNACLRVRTTLEPEALLDACKEIERELGRAPGGVRHGPRPIDIDLLLLGDREFRSERLRLPHAEVAVGSVDRVLASSYAKPFDLVVLDPPREGARRTVVEQVVARRPRAVAYVACDPAALARDLATFAEHGHRLETLRAFDLFPMTHHVECVALIVPS